MRKSRRKKRKNNSLNGWGIIKKSVLKITAVLMILAINWTALSAMIETIAYYNDIENSLENSLSAGTLDFSLDTPGDFSLNFTSLQPALRNISVINDGSLLFQYIIETTEPSGELCDIVELEARLNGDTKYSGLLTDFVLEPAVDFTTPSDWEFIFSVSGDIEEYNNKPCQFYFDFKAWQNNLEIYPEGFSDIERTFTHLMLRDEKAIVLNEFLPNPIYDECGREGILGEWVEIYNNGAAAADLEGWYVEDGQENKIFITAENTLNKSTIIGPKGSGSEWLVVFLNDCVLDNEGDTVSLYNPEDQLIDSYSYSGSAPESKSYARYPDGTGPWYDPIPTPGGPNQLEIEEIEAEEETIIIVDGLFVAAPTAIEQIFGKPSEEVVDEELIIIEELAPDEIIIDLPEISSLETTTPSDEPLFEEPEQTEGAKLLEEEPALSFDGTPEGEPEPELEPEPDQQLEPNNLENNNENSETE